MNSEPLSESSPNKGKGSFARIFLIPAKVHTCALFFRATQAVQPVATSVAVSVKACALSTTPPSWPTRSISRKPGRCSSHSLKVRIGIWCLSNVPGLVWELALELILLSLGRQQAIDGRRAHLSQLLFYFRTTLDLAAPLEQLNHFSEHRRQPLAADVVHHPPDHH